MQHADQLEPGDLIINTITGDMFRLLVVSAETIHVQQTAAPFVTYLIFKTSLAQPHWMRAVEFEITTVESEGV